jgi:hypothetical protein
MLGLRVKRAEDLVGDDADPLIALEDTVAGDGGIEEAVGLNGAVEVGVVVGFLRGVSGGEAALEGVAGFGGLRGCGLLGLLPSDQRGRRIRRGRWHDCLRFCMICPH